jgi:P27 family predicted phage terminase small subunit
MMSRGPVPQSNNLKLLRGNPGRRPLAGTDLEFEPLKDLTPPAGLSKHAEEEWNRVAPELAANGLLTVVDVPPLLIYCNAWSRYLECQELIDREGLMQNLTLKNGEPYSQQHPAVGVAKTQIDIMNKFGAKFGLTPLERGRLKATDTTQQDKSEAAKKRERDQLFGKRPNAE